MSNCGSRPDLALQNQKTRPKGGFLVLNKESGELTLFKPEELDKPNIKEKIKTEISELQTKRNELDVDSNETEKELELLNAKIQKQRSILDLKQSVYRETYQTL